MKPITSALLMLFFFCSTALAQKTPVDFGKVNAGDFVLPANNIIDKNAGAVIIADLGNTTFKGDNEGWIGTIFKRKTRIKILDKKAFELATVQIPLYVDGDIKEKLENFTAVTYNLENGNVVATKMEKKDLFTTKVDKNRILQKFTLPAVKENSIIEYSYTVFSNFDFNLPEWEFQNADYPCLWSEYAVTIPNLVNYIFQKSGVHSFYVDKPDEGRETYLIKKVSENAIATAGNDMLTVGVNTVMHRWVMKDVPAFYVENYLFSPKNYIDKIEFQLSARTYDGVTFHPVKNTWTKATDDFLKTPYFASFITNTDGNEWLDKYLKTIVKPNTTELQQAKDIFYYVSDNFSCTNYYDKYVETTLENVFKSKKGGVGEINLLLTDMLLRNGITAVPVVLSTRAFGYNYPSYPIMGRLNYVICKATIDNRVYYLDASRPSLGFGLLPMDCYNGHARVIGQRDTASIYFLADSIKEVQSTFVRIINPEDGKGGLLGSYEKSMGYMNSYELRESVAKTGIKKYFENLKTESSNEIEITETGIDSLKLPEMPVKIKADFNIKSITSNDIIYLNPVFWDGFRANPFSAAERKYPIEMPYPINQTYVFMMEIPTGFKVEELPKSTKVSYNGNEGFFEYLVQKDENNIQLRSRIVLNKAFFGPDDYNSLRDFFGFVVKKQSEQIVLKKK